MLSTEMWICRLKGGSILLPALFVDLRRAVCCVQEGRPEPAPAAGPQAGRAVLQEPQESPARVWGLPRAAVSAATPQRSACPGRGHFHLCDRVSSRRVGTPSPQTKTSLRQTGRCTCGRPPTPSWASRPHKGSRAGGPWGRGLPVLLRFWGGCLRALCDLEL